MTIAEVQRDYDATVSALGRTLRAASGREIDDPARAVETLLKLVDMDEPPRRRLLGADAVAAAPGGEPIRVSQIGGAADPWT